jgi:hypothetical protein
MTKQEIRIFGDSYAARQTQQNVIFSWPRGLEENYNVINVAHSGEGPQGVLDSINRCILSMPNLTDRKIIAVVMLPEICRYPYSFYKNIKDRVYGQVRLQSSEKFKDTIKQDIGEDKLKFLIDFHEYYLRVDNNRKIEEMKTLGLLNHYATYFKKMLVWPTDMLYVYNNPVDRILFDGMVNYDFAPITVETISAIREDVTDCWPGDPTRINHISLLHHRIMYNELVEWIENNKLPEDKFVYDPNAGNDGNILN